MEHSRGIPPEIAAWAIRNRVSITRANYGDYEMSIEINVGHEVYHSRMRISDSALEHLDSYQSVLGHALDNLQKELSYRYYRNTEPRTLILNP